MSFCGNLYVWCEDTKLTLSAKFSSEFGHLKGQQRLLMLESLVSPEEDEAVKVGMGMMKAPACDYTRVTHDEGGAIKVGPMVRDIHLYKDNIHNVKTAVTERLVKKQRQPTISKTEAKQLKAMALEMNTKIFHRANVQRIVLALLDPDYASGKWSAERVQKGLDDLRARYNPKYVFKSKVKLEPLKKGKPPRILIADGDEGQVMAMLTIGVIERLLFEVYGDRSIKGKSKEAAMDFIAKNFNWPGQLTSSIETDGNAWDTTCSLEIRDATENPIVHHVLNMLLSILHSDEKALWGKAHDKTCTMDTYQVKIPIIGSFDAQHKTPEEVLKNKASVLKGAKIEIDAIRRSGHRGTSVLNWIINFMCTCWAIYGKECSHFVSMTAVHAVDITGIRRWIKMAFEGDDGLSLISPRPNAEFISTVSERWRKMGFNMVLKVLQTGGIVEFTGWKFLMQDDGIVPDSAVPDLPRMLGNSSVCTSKMAVAAYKLQKFDVVERIAAGAYMSAASMLAKKIPSVGRYMLKLSEEWLQKPGFVFERGVMMELDPCHFDNLVPQGWWNVTKATRKTLERATKLHSYEEQIQVDLAGASLERESELVVAHGWAADGEEWERFREALLLIGVESSDAAIRECLPSGM